MAFLRMISFLYTLTSSVSMAASQEYNLAPITTEPNLEDVERIPTVQAYTLYLYAMMVIAKELASESKAPQNPVSEAFVVNSQNAANLATGDHADAILSELQFPYVDFSERMNTFEKSILLWIHIASNFKVLAQEITVRLNQSPKGSLSHNFHHKKILQNLGFDVSTHNILPLGCLAPISVQNFYMKMVREIAKISGFIEGQRQGFDDILDQLLDDLHGEQDEFQASLEDFVLSESSPEEGRRTRIKSFRPGSGSALRRHSKYSDCSEQSLESERTTALRTWSTASRKYSDD